MMVKVYWRMLWNIRQGNAVDVVCRGWTSRATLSLEVLEGSGGTEGELPQVYTQDDTIVRSSED
jgi:hypothetical protein